MAFLAEFLRFLRVRKKYWLLPILVTMLLLGVILMLLQSAVVAPFIYTLF